MRRERKRERERDMRLEVLGKKTKTSRDRDRDVTERIALGMQPAGGKLSGDAMYDQRLFNQVRGVAFCARTICLPWMEQCETGVDFGGFLPSPSLTHAVARAELGLQGRRGRRRCLHKGVSTGEPRGASSVCVRDVTSVQGRHVCAFLCADFVTVADVPAAGLRQRRQAHVSGSLDWRGTGC